MQGWKSPLLLPFQGPILNKHYILMPRLVLLSFLCGRLHFGSIGSVFKYVFFFLQGSKFLQDFHSVDQSRFSNAWDEIQRPQIPHYQGRPALANFPSEQPLHQQDFDGNFESFLLLIWGHCSSRDFWFAIVFFYAGQHHLFSMEFITKVGSF